MSHLARRLHAATALVAAAALGAAVDSASASLIILSTDSSDETAAAVLDATLDFTVDSILGTMSLTVTNETTVPAAYNMTEVYFNIGEATSFAVDGSLPTGWSLVLDAGVDGFGTFDICLTDGSMTDVIIPGASLVFDFTFDSGTAAKGDFTTNLSVIPPGATPALAAAKFIQGPGDDSAFGATVPAPGVLGLLGLAALAGPRRRRSAA